MIVAFARVMRTRLEEEIASVDRGLLGGNLKDFNEYHRLSGRRQGLMEAVALVDEIMNKFDSQP